MFRSDVIHAGGCIEVDMEQGQKYHHLHFYLSTKFQVADPEVINYWHFDMRTLLKDIYLNPKFPTGSDDEDEAEESSDDGMEREVVDEDDDEEEEMPIKVYQIIAMIFVAKLISYFSLLLV
jgi:hypothetical protein